MNLSATPGRPACPSRASGWSSLTPPWGLPCCVRFPCVHAVATTPAQRLGVLLRSFSPAVSAFPERVAGSSCAASFSRFARRSLALRPAHSRRHQFVTRYPEGFSTFVTSMTAPVASGWSVRRVGRAPSGKRRLSTAHTLTGHERRTFAAMQGADLLYLARDPGLGVTPMRLRDFIMLLGGVAAASPLAARAQQREKMRRIGVLMNTTADDPAHHARAPAFLP